MTLTAPLGISSLFDEEFYEGSAPISPADLWPTPVAIAGHRYILEWAKFQRTTVSPFREARDQNALPGEQSLNPLGAWKRTRDDWSLGAGQTWADRALEPFNTKIEIEPRLFRTSKGLDPWTLGAVTLLPDTELAWPMSSSTIKMVSLGVYIYFTDGLSLMRSTSLGATTVTVTTITGLSGLIKDFTTDGSRIYVSTSTGMFIHVTTGTTATALPGAAATYSPAILQWANGWLFGCDTNRIREVRADGTVNLVFTHLNPDFLFAAITGTPGFSYFGGQSSDVNEIYRVGTKTDGTLGPGIFSGSLPKGPFLRAMGYYGGFVLLCASNGFHIAAVTGDGSLELSPLIPTPGDVRCCIPEGKFIWFGWSNYDATSSGLGRVNLSEFSDNNNLIPAYASDLMYSTGGTVTSVVRYGISTFFAVSGVGIIRQHATRKVAQGTLSMGRFRWGTYEPKVWIGIEIISDSLVGSTDGTVSANILDDAGGSTSVGVRGPTNGSTGLGQVYGIGTITDTHDWFEPVLIISRGPNPSQAPIVRRVTLRALPTPKTVEQFTIPIIMSRTVLSQTQEGQEIGYDTAEEYRFLQQLVQQSKTVTLQIGGESHLVTVREVGWDQVYGMTPSRMGIEGLIMATLITAET